MSKPLSLQLAELSARSNSELITRIRKIFRTAPTQRANRQLLAAVVTHTAVDAVWALWFR